MQIPMTYEQAIQILGVAVLQQTPELWKTTGEVEAAMNQFKAALQFFMDANRKLLETTARVAELEALLLPPNAPENGERKVQEVEA